VHCLRVTAVFRLCWNHLRKEGGAVGSNSKLFPQIFHSSSWAFSSLADSSRFFFLSRFFLLFLAVVIGAKLFPTRATESWGWERGKLFFRLLLVDETISEISNIRIRIN
jgi:hypothetical protein